MFKLEDTIKEINDNAKTIKTLSVEETNEINSRINSQMEKVNLEYRRKQAQSIEAAKIAYITF